MPNLQNRLYDEEAFCEWYESLREKGLPETAASIGAAALMLIFTLEEISRTNPRDV